MEPKVEEDEVKKIYYTAVTGSLTKMFEKRHEN